MPLEASTGRRGEVTQLLAELGQGATGVTDRLVHILYDELRQIARRHMRGERLDHTLETTALVHEAYVKLVGLDRMHWQNRAHFLAVAAQAMRRVLVDYAVGRRTQKRGGSPAMRWPSGKGSGPRPTGSRPCSELRSTPSATPMGSLGPRQPRSPFHNETLSRRAALDDPWRRPQSRPYS